MPYFACPACSEGIDISEISFTVDAETQLWDTMETDDKTIWCPHCKEKYIISIQVDFFNWGSITNEDRTYDDMLDIEWDGEGAPALEYYDEEDE